MADGGLDPTPAADGRDDRPGGAAGLVRPQVLEGQSQGCRRRQEGPDPARGGAEARMITATLIGVKRLLVRLALAISRYKMVGTTSERVGVFVGAPHTSNWDFVVAVMVMWHNGLPLRVLVKDDLFKGPLAWVLRAFGGIAIDRHNA